MYRESLNLPENIGPILFVGDYRERAKKLLSEPARKLPKKDLKTNASRFSPCSKALRANAQNVSTSFLLYGGITYLINSFDYPNLF